MTSHQESSAKSPFQQLSPRGTTWRLILDTALDAAIVMSSDGMVVDWNDNAIDIFGWSREEAIGRNMAELIIPQQYRAAHSRGLERFCKTGEGSVLGKRIEISGLRRAGEEFPVELSISPIREQDGLVFVGFIRDISERKQADVLREQNALKAEVLYRAVSFAATTNSFEDALKTCLDSVHKLTGWPIGHIYFPSNTSPARLVPSSIWYNTQPENFIELRAITEETSFASEEGLPGTIWASGEPMWISDVDADPQFPRAKRPGGVGIKSAFGFPIKSGGQIIAIVEFFSDVSTQPDAELLLTLRAIGDQVGRVFERRNAEQALREHAQVLENEIEERKRVEEHQKLLLAELNHRVKNVLAVVTGIAWQTGRNTESVAAFNESFLARLEALGRAHSLLTADNWEASSLKSLVQEILSPYALFESRRLDISGPPVSLKPKSALAVGMILHELVTNAAKYGALSAPNGKVAVHWTINPRPRPAIHLQWRETGVGVLSPPGRKGFGSTMIEASVHHELRGKVKVAYVGDGIHYDFEFPVS